MAPQVDWTPCRRASAPGPLGRHHTLGARPPRFSENPGLIRENEQVFETRKWGARDRLTGSFFRVYAFRPLEIFVITLRLTALARLVAFTALRPFGYSTPLPVFPATVLLC